MNAVRGDPALARERGSNRPSAGSRSSLKNGSPQADTITLLAHMAEVDDDKDLRAAAASVHGVLKKRATERA